MMTISSTPAPINYSGNGVRQQNTDFLSFIFNAIGNLAQPASVSSKVQPAPVSSKVQPASVSLQVQAESVSLQAAPHGSDSPTGSNQGSSPPSGPATPTSNSMTAPPLPKHIVYLVGGAKLGLQFSQENKIVETIQGNAYRLGGICPGDTCTVEDIKGSKDVTIKKVMIFADPNHNDEGQPTPTKYTVIVPLGVKLGIGFMGTDENAKINSVDGLSKQLEFINSGDKIEIQEGDNSRIVVITKPTATPATQGNTTTNAANGQPNGEDAIKSMDINGDLIALSEFVWNGPADAQQVNPQLGKEGEAPLEPPKQLG